MSKSGQFARPTVQIVQASLLVAAACVTLSAQEAVTLSSEEVEAVLQRSSDKALYDRTRTSCTVGRGWAQVAIAAAGLPTLEFGVDFMTTRGLLMDLAQEHARDSRTITAGDVAVEDRALVAWIFVYPRNYAATLFGVDGVEIRPRRKAQPVFQSRSFTSVLDAENTATDLGMGLTIRRKIDANVDDFRAELADLRDIRASDPDDLVGPMTVPLIKGLEQLIAGLEGDIALATFSVTDVSTVVSDLGRDLDVVLHLRGRNGATDLPEQKCHLSKKSIRRILEDGD